MFLFSVSVLKLPLCSINPNFAIKHGGSSAASSPIREQVRGNKQGGRLSSRIKQPAIKPEVAQDPDEAAVSSLLDKFLKSTQTQTAQKSEPSNHPLPPIPTTATIVSTNGNVRSDRRCGSEFPLPDGTISECDPNGANYCCSKWGYCGPGAEHCDCPECVDYRNENSPGNNLAV